MTENKAEKRVPIPVLALYSALLYGVWGVYHFYILKHIVAIPNELIAALLNDGVCKNLVWTLPALLLIRKYSDSLKIGASEMLTWKKEYLPYLAIFPAFAAYIVLNMVLHKMPIEFSMTITDAVTVLFVGVTEELVFRGWLLNATMAYTKEPENDDATPWSQYGAVALNAVMFLVIHFPRWLSEGAFAANFTSLGFVSIVLLSVIFSLVFLKTRNIVLPITLHMFWDLLIFMMY